MLYLDEIFETPFYQIRLASAHDLHRLFFIEQACWALELQTPSSDISDYIEQRGCYVIVYQERIVGAVYSQRIAERNLLLNIRHQAINSLHDANHPILQLIKINVLPNEQQLGFGDALLSWVLQQAVLTEGVQSIVAVTRCLNYLSHAKDFSFEAYVHSVNEDLLPIDPILLFHTSHGAKIIDILPGYRIEDHDNLGHGVLVEYAIRGEMSMPGTGKNALLSSKMIHDIVTDITRIFLEAHHSQSDYKSTLAFQELGFDSLDLTRYKNMLNQALAISLDTSVFFRYSSPAALIKYIQQQLSPDLPVDSCSSMPNQAADMDDVAIIGMSCRFPGDVHSPEDFWTLLSSGGSGIIELPPERELIWNTYSLINKENPALFHGGFIEDVDKFDAGFFGISPREAIQIDPQHRLLLELHWHALEHAGIDPHSLAGSQTGIYVGIFTHDYELLRQKYSDEVSDKIYLATGSSESVAAGRISYCLDLIGPAIAVNTACSSSLVAVHLACQSLRHHEVNLALASGVNLMLTSKQTEIFAAANMLSKTGQCRVFDEGATGYVRSEGVGVIVLKRLTDAIKDNDKIWAVIRGTAVNQDGASNGLTAPNQLSQEKLMRQVLEQARCDAHAVSYVEAHGTGTILGDPVELSAIQSVYAQNRPAKKPLYLGAVKSNIGHLEAASGIAGLIKTVLMLEHKAMVKNIHFKRLNPNIVLDKQHIKILTRHKKWIVQPGEKRLAGISSFGFSGTNAHVLLEESPKQDHTKSRHLYPFKRESYWFDPKPTSRSLGIPLSRGFLHSTLSGAGKEKVFNADLSISKEEYLGDHRVFGKVVFPGAGYVELCFEALSYLDKTDVYGVRDLIFERALFIPEEGSVSLQVLVNSERLVEIYSAEDSDWVRHCQGSFSLVSLPEKRINLAGYVARATETWHQTDYHQQADASGIYYGPMFQGLRAIYHLSDGILAEIVLDEEGTYIAHPAVLDSCIQSISGLFDGEQSKHYLPVGIKAVVLKGRLPTHVWVKADRASLVSKDNRVMVTLELYSPEGELIGLFDELSLQAVSAQQFSKQYTVESDLYYELVWQSYGRVNSDGYRLGFAGLGIDELAFTVVSSVQSGIDLESIYQTLALSYIIKAFKMLSIGFGVGDKLIVSEVLARGAIATRHHRLTRHLFSLLQDGGFLDSNWRVLKTLDSSLPSIEDYIDSNPLAQIELTLLSRCGEHLSEILQDRVEALDVLFTEEASISASSLYYESLDYVAINEQVARGFEEFLSQYPKDKVLRILEIGAGTGGTTRHILPLLQASGHVVDYIYTDISGGFFEQAKASFAAYAFVRYQTLNIEEAVHLQGFGFHQYDVVIAANVLHATCSLSDTLSHVKSLLVPGGYLLLLELTSRSCFVDLTFGLLDGWWRFNDEALRAEHPLLTLSAWQTLLRDEGFSSRELGSSTQQSIILSQYVDYTPVDIHQTWVLIHDVSSFRTAFSLRLSAMGVRLHELSVAEACLAETWSRIGSCDRVIYAALSDSSSKATIAERTELQSVHALQAIQALLRALMKQQASWPVFDLLVEQDLSCSALWGVGRSLQNEYIDWAVRIIGFDETDGFTNLVQQYVASAFDASGENQLRLLGDEVSICRLQASELNQIREDFVWASLREDGVYLITGGLSGIGYAVCEWLAEK
ncbi:MAG: beta-ketoacyl synthase N-terminal-like domain-containing protein, partial [Legionellaceae bacterium]|nr:beta-ketoacyl synthase N-terminal-like domain-containing protein [Legionellaceae bacterium]